MQRSIYQEKRGRPGRGKEDDHLPRAVRIHRRHRRVELGLRQRAPAEHLRLLRRGADSDEGGATKGKTRDEGGATKGKTRRYGAAKDKTDVRHARPV